MIYSNLFSFLFSPETDYVLLSMFGFLFHLPTLILFHLLTNSHPNSISNLHYALISIVGTASVYLLTRNIKNRLILCSIYISSLALMNYREIQGFIYLIAPLSFVELRKSSRDVRLSVLYYFASYMGSIYLRSPLLFSFLIVDLVRLFLLQKRIWSIIKRGLLILPPFGQTLVRNSIMFLSKEHLISGILSSLATAYIATRMNSRAFSEEEILVIEELFDSRPEFITKIEDDDYVNELKLFGMIISNYWFAFGKHGYTFLSSCKKIEESTDCAICLSQTPIACQLSCEHAFCPECLLSWSIRSSDCPLCRKKIN
ncbi:MAG: hypothetical protein Solivirus2_44 [Solivirus sp.]|uniref:RING-type domain-containing protein n=1 Tax=Solivirus sp. TaxID=2487772 RepID=A0A3G5AJE3_9VIRU|nr:MAG: hypothetical protein Solivirus2_44 [Solivirus sp.]